ncbi:MAG: HAD family hydrolase [Pseudomonadota bacterium]|nr:HAD family hydrolase [Pseudomonadota bacterium]
MRLTLFDLDHTLIAGDSDYEWGQYLIDVGALDRATYENANHAFYEQYKAGTLDIREFLAFALAPLRDNALASLEAWRADFVRTRILPMIGTAARELVERERQRSHLVAIVTATNSFVTAPIAAEFGVQHLIATEPARAADGRFTGAVAGTPSFREGKVVRVDDWLTGLGLAWDQFCSTAFYSDSLNDLPLLQRVAEPVAVDPDPILRAHAEASSWPILSLHTATAVAAR